MSGVANAADERVLLALENPADQNECVNPTRIARVGEFIVLQPREDKPPFLNGNVTAETLNALIFDPAYNWKQTSLFSRFGESEIQLYAGGREGQQAILGNPNKRGMIVADFESGSLCKGFIDESFSCYDMAGQLTVSQLAHSVASVLGSSIFLRTQFDNAARLFRFRTGLVSNAMGNPSLEENLLDQGVNESGYQWLSRVEGEDGTGTVTISTQRLDSQLRSTSCQSVGSVRIRPLQLQVGESLTDGEPFMVKMSAKGDLKFVKIGDGVKAVLLTRSSRGWDCALDDGSALCVSASERRLYYLSKHVDFEYDVVFVMQVTRNVESHADLAVLHSQSVRDIMENGFIAPWDLRNLLPLSSSPLEGARSITARLDLVVAVSSGVRLTGTIETWATALYFSILLLFLSIVVFFQIKSWPSINIERMYRRVVWEKETASGSSPTPNTAPTIDMAATVDGGGMMTASYQNMIRKTGSV
ncbi:hypothetical protein FGB62_206g03 [Gracilaria domingensis]|nr:hypothetical protein FGB62_206g03 [Gracilaria domingensis]